MKLIKEEKLLFGLPIETEFGILHQPKMKDFFYANLDYSRFMRAFSIKVDLLFDDPKDMKDFDIFLFQMTNSKESESLIVDLIDSLKLLYKTNKVELKTIGEGLSNIGIFIDDKIFINRDNYSQLSSIVQIILGDGNNVLEEEKKRELDELELEFERRRRKAEKIKRERQKEIEKDKEVITIYDLMNYIIHTDNSQFTYESIMELTIYQIKNTFNLYRQKENYELLIDYKTGGYEIKDEITHWFFKK
jgi:hypothetical protein